eukprot:Lithocolla_globosa_v1_NODE_1284_length_2700_cov_39.953119.p1 type:complete len:607 gc:universal NODE_1284_length_2700_cov_39.953119:1848-28(-)
MAESLPVAEYTLPGVLLFIQQEFKRFQKERNEWTVEKMQLQNRIVFLEGDKVAAENMRSDLLRRVKMLEYALRQERSKSTIDLNASNISLASSTQSVQVQSPVSTPTKEKTEKEKEKDKKQKSKQTKHVSSGGHGRIRGKDILKSYLSQMGDTTDLVSAETKKVAAEASVTPTKPTHTEEPSPVVAAVSPPSPLPTKEKSSSKGTSSLKNLFLPPSGFESPAQQEVESVTAAEPTPSKNEESTPIKLDELASLTVLDEPEAKKSSEKETKESDAPPPKHCLKNTLKSHFDSVRSVAFRTTEPTLLSGSEDGTLKLWNLATLPTGKRSASQDVEPLYTYRGHKGPVFTVAIADDESIYPDPLCFSAGEDGSIRKWMLPPSSLPSYSARDSQYDGDCFSGHDDCVWQLRVAPNSPLLASASSDDTVKIWDFNGNIKTKLSLSKTPTTLTFVHTNPSKLVVGFVDSSLSLFDIETGKQEIEFPSNQTYQNSVEQQINDVISHPTLPLLITAHEDKYLRFFDAQSGKCTQSMVAHLDSVSCLTINPNGLSVISGGHDSSIRVWDVKTYACWQEFSSHRKKYDEAVQSLAFHKSGSFLASGGADATVKVYT